MKSTKRFVSLLLTLAMVASLMVKIPLTAAAAPADDAYDGSQLWMNYTLVSDDALRAQYTSAVQSLVIENYNAEAFKTFTNAEPVTTYLVDEQFAVSSLDAARLELIRGTQGLLGVTLPDVPAASVTANGTVVVGTPETSPIIAGLGLADDLKTVEVGDERYEDGFIIKSMKVNGFDAIVVAANEPIGALYGTYYLLRMMQTQKSLEGVSIAEKPKVNNRHLNNWELTRLYAGNSATGTSGLNGEAGTIFNFDLRVPSEEWNTEKPADWPASGSTWKSTPSTTGTSSSPATMLPNLLDRYITFARACASVGINGIEINLVNGNDTYLYDYVIAQEAALADALRPYGVKISVAINFTAPTRPSAPGIPMGPGPLTKVDPYSEGFQNWWYDRASIIQASIPDFMGFTVKADSEGQPGPQSNEFSHVDGANGLAEAIAPLGMKVFWRTFVYNASVDSDRLKRPYKEFVSYNDDYLRGHYVRNEQGQYIDVNGTPLYEGTITASGQMARVAYSGYYMDAAGNPITTGPDAYDHRYKEPVLIDGHATRGAILPNAFVQTKNGPLDFMGREPIHPMFGAMDNTNQAVELQITQEYTGQEKMLVYLGTMWEEFFKTETGAYTYQKDEWGDYVLDADGEKIVIRDQALVGEILDGSAQGQTDSAIVGVANVGNADNMTGHHFSQSNFFAFGRLAWNWTQTAEEIAEDWTRMTWGNDEEVVSTIVQMMMGSREALVSYQTPLGVSHQQHGSGGAHYPPYPSQHDSQFDWSPTYYNRADGVGMGYNRTSHEETTSFAGYWSQGSGLVDQYFPALRDLYDDIETTPENLLMTFHHVAWDYTMNSGRSFFDELVYRVQMGVQYVTWMRETWDALEPKIDARRWGEVAHKLAVHETDASAWREAFVGYAQVNSKMDIPTDNGPLSIALTLGTGDNTKTYRGFNLSVDSFNKNDPTEHPLNPDASNTAYSQNTAQFNYTWKAVEKAYTLEVPTGVDVSKISVASLMNDEYNDTFKAEVTEATESKIVVKVTREDFFGPLMKNYVFNLVPVANLEGIRINGTSFEDFDPAVLSYHVNVASGASVLPVVTAVNAESTEPVSITQATAVPGTATVTFNGTTYTICFHAEGERDFRDDFESASLGEGWSWIRVNDANWSLTKNPGSMTITIESGTISGNNATAKNILLHDLPEGDWVVESQVTFPLTPSASGQQGGIVVYLNDNTYITARVNRTSASAIRVDTSYQTGGTSTTTGYDDRYEVLNRLQASDSTLWLRIEKKGDVYSTSWATAEGEPGRNIGSYSIPALNNADTKAGLLAMNSNTALDVSYDYFSITSNEQTVEDPKVVVDIRAATTTLVESPVEYIVSLSGAQKVMNIRLYFEVDASMLKGEEPEILSSQLTALASDDGAIRWTHKEGDIWQGDILLMYLGGAEGFTTDAKQDILNAIYTARQLGEATMKLTGVVISGLDAQGNGITLDSEIGIAEATTLIKIPDKVYSAYDLNKDDVVDERDLAMAQRYYMAKEGDANWEQAKVCDFNNDGIVDMVDLIDLYRHFT